MVQEKYLSNFVDELEELIWRKEIGMAYDLSKVPTLEHMKEKANLENAQKTQELRVLEEGPYIKDFKEKKKLLKNEITKLNKEMVNCNDLISRICKSVGSEKEKVKQLKERIDFAKNYKPEQEKNKEIEVSNQNNIE